MRLTESGGHKALSSESRLRILEFLYRGPRSIDEISKETGLRPITLRHHLSQLGGVGLVSTYESRTGRVGRPRTYYKIAKDSPLVSYPKRHYLQLSAILVRSLIDRLGEEGAKSMLREVAKKMGRETVTRLSAERAIDGWTLQHFREAFVEKFLEESGAEPALIEANQEKVVFRVHNCLFYELAMQMPEIICDVMDEVTNREMCLAMNDQWRFSRPMCMAHGDDFCEYVVEA